jgi:hypothetical protein
VGLVSTSRPYIQDGGFYQRKLITLRAASWLKARAS